MSETMFVSRNRTVMLNGAANGPGAMVILPADEAAFLQERGFLQAEPPVLNTPATELNPSGIGLQNQHVQGPRY